MSKIRLKTLKTNRNSGKKVSEIHVEYMEYCKSIGQRKGTLESKERFYRISFH